MHTPRPESVDVLVVGAGPVGMLTAAILTQHGVHVQIIASHRPDAIHSRATVIWPRVLELLHQVGVADTVIASGHRLIGVDYLSTRRRLASVRVDALTDTPFPFAVALRQRDTEQILRDALTELGVQIRNDTILRALENRTDQVVAQLDTADGPRSVHARWVVGADGAHSTVRKLSGAHFRGEQLKVAFAITDAVLTGEISREVMSYYYSSRGSLALAPLDDTTSRIAVSVPFDTSIVEPSRDFFQAIVDERGATHCTVGELDFSAIFRVHARNADRFRYGRILLAGDAAHVMSPAAAQGMNTGLQDAAALAWRLSMIVNGDAAADILDQYERERRRAARDVVAATTTQTKWGVATGVRVPLRATALTVYERSGMFQRSLAPKVAQTNTSYNEEGHLADAAVLSSGRRRLEKGARLPALPTFAGDGQHVAPPSTHSPLTAKTWPTVASNRFTLVTFPQGSKARRSDIRAHAAALAQRFDLPCVAGDAQLQLPTRSRFTSCVVVVRPDGHIHEVVRVDSHDRWAATLADVLSAVYAKAGDSTAEAA